MKLALTATLVFLLLLPAASACLEPWEVLQWHDLELQLNVSNDTFVNLAEKQCVRSAIMTDVSGQLTLLDNKIENLKDSIDYEHIDMKVDQRMDNWTEYMEREAGLGPIRVTLAAIYNNTFVNASDVDMGDYVTRTTFDSEIGRIDIDLYNRAQPQNQLGYNPYQGTDPAFIIGILFVIGIGIFFAFKMGWIKFPSQNQPPPVQLPVSPPATAAAPASPDQVFDARNKLAKEMKEAALKRKVDLLMDRMTKETNPMKIKALETEVNNLVKEADDLDGQSS